MRREAPRRIPGAAGRNSEGGFWVGWLTSIRKVTGTRACQESGGHAQVSGVRCGETRVIWRKLDCLNLNLQAMQRIIRRKDTRNRRHACNDIVEGSMQPPERGAMPSEGIQGDEWGAYVTLGRTTGTNAGSPTGREPYGDGVPVVVVGVTTHQGGRESRPQGKGAQVTGYPNAGRYA